MISIVKSEDRGRTKIDWLDSRHSFSFNMHYDPENLSFGPLRVLNHDIIQPDSGFPRHPHNNMEIVTIVLEGELTHEDSTGTRETISEGEVQRMSAGSGIIHSEFNNHKELPVNLLQIWLVPYKAELEPSYQQVKYDKTKVKNNLLKVVSGEKNDSSIFIHQDTEIFISELDEKNNLNYDITEDRGVYLYLIDGKIRLNDESLNPGDAAKVTDENNLMIIADKDSKFVLFDVKM